MEIGAKEVSILGIFFRFRFNSVIRILKFIALLDVEDVEGLCSREGPITQNRLLCDIFEKTFFSFMLHPERNDLFQRN